MKLSKYTKIYPHGKSRLMLYSTLTTATVVIDKGLLSDIQKGNLSSSDKESLLGDGIITKNQMKEKEFLQTFIDRQNALNKKLNILTVLNLDCNLACPYCFEKNVKGKLYMNEATVGPLIDFISSQLSSKKKELCIDFYGGEPLLSLGLVKKIAQKTKKIADKFNAGFGFTLITNGTLLTKKAIDALVPLGLKRAKVTLDGPKDNHDIYRPFKTGKGSFDIIVKNLTYACNRIKIGIGGNFSKGNYKRFPELLDYLVNIGITPEKLHIVKFDPIIKTGNLCTYSSACGCVNEPWLIKTSIKLREEILKRGFKTAHISPSPCAIFNSSNFIVNYDGSIYKCPAFIGHEHFKIGALSTNINDYTDIYKSDAWKNEDCLGCAYLPLCFGGCKYMKYVRTGNVEGIDCKREFLDGALKALIRQEVKYLY